MAKKKLYAIRVTEEICRTYAVEAETVDEALDKVSAAYDASEIILTSDDFVGEPEIEVSPYVKDGILTPEEAECYIRFE